LVSPSFRLSDFMFLVSFPSFLSSLLFIHDVGSSSSVSTGFTGVTAHMLSALLRPFYLLLCSDVWVSRSRATLFSSLASALSTVSFNFV
jgi:hypothetical protein